MTGGVNNWFIDKYGIKNKRVLLYVGKMEHRRHPLFLLELMQNLSDEYILVLVGDGPIMDDVNAFITTHNLSNVLVLGRRNQDELSAIYESADLFLLASDYEIFGMVILEAMYFGVPVISTSTAGSNTIITKDSGVIISNYNEELWLQAIKKICKDTSTLQKMKQSCRSMIRERFVWDKAVVNYLKLYGL